VLDQVMVGTVMAKWRLKYLNRVIEDCVVLTDVWVFDEGRWQAPAVFAWLAGLGVERGEMRRVFNGGIGFAAVVPAGEAPVAIEACHAAGCEAWQVGEIVPGEGVEYQQEP